MAGTLYLIATPIGNLQDISLRALEILKTVDMVACEDTRHTGKLLKQFSIYQKLISYHDHNESERADELVELLKLGMSIAIVSDAGTPGIADPSFRIVKKAHEIGADVVPVPGPVAFVNALVASGLPTDAIFFGGFLPARPGERRKRLREVADIPATLCFYETPHRISKSLNDCRAILGDRKASVVRELTKMHEEIRNGTLAELADEFDGKETKGELVIVIDRSTPADRTPAGRMAESVVERYEDLRREGLERKMALKKASREFEISKSEAYRLVQEHGRD